MNKTNQKLPGNMNRTPIEWLKNPDGSKGCTWNPVMGCKRGCPYCYARKIHHRFLPEHPFNEPVFYEDRLDQPQRLKKSSRVFVVSMGDLFGDRVPGKWISRVFDACEAAPQHTYYFLTKNPERLQQYNQHGEISNVDNWWFGCSATSNDVYFDSLFRKMPAGIADGGNLFVSLEPLFNEINSLKLEYACPRWVIVGAETGNRKGKIVPKREWLLDIRQQCRDLKIPLFEKNSLAGLDLPGGLIQEWPKNRKED